MEPARFPLSLRQLLPKDEAAFISSADLWKGEDRSWYSFLYNPKDAAEKRKFNYSGMLETIHNEHRGIKLKDDRVPATMLYAFFEKKIIGRFHIRHTLNPRLMHRGGHIGYAVATDFKKIGVASEMMLQGLSFTRREFGLSKVLITCGDTNLGSCGVIEKYGGILENKVWDEADKENIRRYWVTIK